MRSYALVGRYLVPVLGCALALALGPFALNAAGAAQDGAPQTLQRLRALAPGTAAQALQVRLRWTTDEPTSNPADTRNHFETVSVERLAMRAMAPRTSEVGPDTLVVVGETLTGRELSWRVILDPRVVRAEASSAATLAGERLVYAQSELLFALPELSGTVRVRVYKPRSEGGRIVLDELGTATLR